ncbi:hypothetical protein N7533_002100 [Penicillium manginii]|uniref:uncharacterized protein n=1 Tax=Penicillium manginii TaxID=203109 RepID=UPI0025465B56|nr:uncharacterized protein N7533_002100 [Penicillium manginii]KAJ5763419.1 hypothetical protein N7533_002100 [Penicillium manginii]
MMPTALTPMATPLLDETSVSNVLRSPPAPHAYQFFAFAPGHLLPEYRIDRLKSGPCARARARACIFAL